MFDTESIPKDVPELGFYHHKKHDPIGPLNDKAYELVGVGYHTETGEHTALYRPLYEEAWSYQAGKLTYVRPLAMFMDSEEVNGTVVQRFTKIRDQESIAALTLIRNAMYG